MKPFFLGTKRIQEKQNFVSIDSQIEENYFLNLVSKLYLVERDHCFKRCMQTTQFLVIVFIKIDMSNLESLSHILKQVVWKRVV